VTRDYDAVAMNWKTYYATEVRSPDASRKMTEWLERARREPISSGFPCTGVLSFPHTTLDAAGPLQAAVVEAIYRSGCRRVLALGVLHTSRLSAAFVASDATKPAPERVRAFHELAGGFLPAADDVATPFGTLSVVPTAPAPDVPVRTDNGGVLRDEFSLDTFLAMLRLGAIVFGARPPQVIPIYVGLTRHPVSGSFAVAHALGTWLRERWDEAAIVATGDVVHYGAFYGSAIQLAPLPELEVRLVERLKESFRCAFEQGDDAAAYEIGSRTLRSDQREMLPAVARLLDSGAHGDILAYEWTDYAGILHVAPPCRVASALIAYAQGVRRKT